MSNFGILPAEWRASSISDNLDWIDVIAYDFFAPGWSPNVTGPPASLYNPISPISGDSGLSAWLQACVRASKIAFGLPFYGHAWNLTDPDQHAGRRSRPSGGRRGWRPGGGGLSCASKNDCIWSSILWLAWSLTDQNQHGIFAPASGMAVPPDGSAGYNLIKAYIAENGAPFYTC
ncbi:unnamed protein product [Prunus brigantina]